MEELQILEFLKNFAGGNTLVLLYIAHSIVKYCLVPIYKGGKTIKELATAATEALKCARTGHADIAAELRQLNEKMDKN